MKTTRLPRALLVLLLGSCGVACDDRDSRPLPSALPEPAPTPTPPPQPPPAPPPPASPTALELGEWIERTLDGDSESFTVTASRRGTLVVRVVYDAFYWDTILTVKIDDQPFPPDGPPFSPIIARVPVTGGQTCVVEVVHTGVGMAPYTIYTIQPTIE